MDLSSWSISFSFSLKNFKYFLARLGLLAPDSLNFYLCVRVFIFPSLLKNKVTGYRILGWCHFFSQCFTYFFLLSRCLGSVWEVRCNSCFCSVGKVFSSCGFFHHFSLFLIICSLSMKCLGVVCFFALSCLLFSELPGSMVSCLIINLGTSSTTTVSDILLLSHFSSRYSHYVFVTFCSCPTVHGYSVVFCQSLFSAFQFGKFLLIYFHVQRLSSVVSSPVFSPSRHFSFLVQCF